MFMMEPEERDVSPNTPGAGNAVGSGVDVVDQTVTGCETTQGPVRKGSVEFWAASDKYRLKHKEKISKMPPSSFLKPWPLNSDKPPKPSGTKKDPESKSDSDHRGEKEYPRASQNGSNFSIPEPGNAPKFPQTRRPKS